MNGSRETAAHPFIDRVRNTISELSLIQPGDRVLIAFSGGPDSAALARALLALVPSLGIAALGLAHLNHGLRGVESDSDETFARDFARHHGLECHVSGQDITALARNRKISLEEAGRDARYAFFEQVALEKGFTRIALGHHRDDHIEQVLMNLIRGTGPGGLKGIPPSRKGGIIRPLIRVSKTEIQDFLSDLNQPFVTDQSNADPSFLRNRVRLSLIPVLEASFNPDIRTGLDRLSRIMALEDDFLETETQNAFNAVVLKTENQEIRLSVMSLPSLHPAIANRVIRKALGRVKGDLRRISFGHIQDIIALAGSGVSGKHLDLPGQIRVYSEKGTLCLRKEALPLRKLGLAEKQDKKPS